MQFEQRRQTETRTARCVGETSEFSGAFDIGKVRARTNFMEGEY